MQTYTLEQFVWDSEREVFKTQVRHAEEMARRVCGVVEDRRTHYRCGLLTHRGEPGCICSLIDAMEFTLNPGEIEKMLGEYGVANELFEYATRLVQQLAKVRYGDIAQ